MIKEHDRRLRQAKVVHLSKRHRRQHQVSRYLVDRSALSELLRHPRVKRGTKVIANVRPWYWVMTCSLGNLRLLRSH